MIVDDWFMQMWQGNQVAWLAFGLVIAVVGLMSMLGIGYWKLPQPAKKMFWNNIHGGGKPNVFNGYEDQSVRLENPQMYREGILHNPKNKSWYFVMTLTKESEGELGSNVNRELITKAFRMEGAPGAVYFAYSNKGTIMNPELLAMIEQEKETKSEPEETLVGRIGERLKEAIHGKEPRGQIKIDKQAFINALNRIKDSQVVVDPVYVTTLLDMRKIKAFLPKAFTKDRLLSHENKVKEIMRKLYEGAGNKAIMVLLVIILIVNILGVVKSFGVF